MDSPLNLAHRCHRKAEYYLKERRYQDSIDCHLKAVQHLTEAISGTTCDKIRASLESQKSFHSSQEKVLKQRQLCESKRIEKYRQDLKNRQIIIQRFGAEPNLLKSPIMANPQARGSADVDSKNNHMMSEIMEVFSEHDSLLQFLIERRVSSQSSPVGLSPSDSSSNVVSSTDSLYKSGSKRPKDDKTVIEELQTVNEKLRQLVFQLYSDLEVSQKENRALEEENHKLRDERNAISSTVPELPPLEPPELLY